MISDFEKCLISSAECSRVNTCRYTLKRFGVFDCEPESVKKQKIEEKYQKELRDREEMLKSKFKEDMINDRFARG